LCWIVGVGSIDDRGQGRKDPRSANLAATTEKKVSLPNIVFVAEEKFAAF